MSDETKRGFSLNDFHRANFERQREAFAPPHPLMALVACVQEEVGELAAAVLGVTGEKKRKAHLTNADVLDAVADAMTYLSLVASNVGCMDLEKLLGDTFNMVSDRAGSKIKVTLAPTPPEPPTTPFQRYQAQRDEHVAHKSACPRCQPSAQGNGCDVERVLYEATRDALRAACHQPV